VTFTTMGLRDSIPRSFFPIMGDMNDRGHAYINLCAPSATQATRPPTTSTAPKPAAVAVVVVVVAVVPPGL
jgi:hypothetical protein